MAKMNNLKKAIATGLAEMPLHTYLGAEVRSLEPLKEDILNYHFKQDPKFKEQLFTLHATNLLKDCKRFNNKLLKEYAQQFDEELFKKMNKYHGKDFSVNYPRDILNFKINPVNILSKSLKNISKGVKKSILPLIMVGLMAYMPMSANAQDNKTSKVNKSVKVEQQKEAQEKGFLDEIVDRVSISGTYTNYLNADPMKAFYDKLNSDAKIGTVATGLGYPLPQWKDYQSPKLNSALGAGLNFRVLGDKKDFSVDVTGALESINATSNYDEIYTTGNSIMDPINIKRTENLNLAKTSFGAKIKKNIIKNLGIFLAGSLDSYHVTGDSNLDMYVRAPPITSSTYLQNRKAIFGGDGNGITLSLGGEYKIDPVTLKISGNYNSANIKTIGKQTRTQNTNNQVTEYDYSPEIKNESVSLTVSASINF